VTVAVPPAGLPPRRTPFAHASEAELARILDFYEVRWRYEPDTFPIGWSLDGDVVESFAPDFYLPDLELYVELTTLKQKLVRKKNRKLRRLRELYPDVRIKLFYARDFRMLMLKFGRLALADELSGTTGQSTPPRVHPADAALPSETPLDPATPADAAAGAATDDDAPADEIAATGAHGHAVRGRRRGRRRRAAARAAEAARLVAAGGSEPA
jgi:hypothetical protein